MKIKIKQNLKYRMLDYSLRCFVSICKNELYLHWNICSRIRHIRSYIHSIWTKLFKHLSARDVTTSKNLFERQTLFSNTSFSKLNINYSAVVLYLNKSVEIFHESLKFNLIFFWQQQLLFYVSNFMGVCKRRHYEESNMILIFFKW